MYVNRAQRLTTPLALQNTRHTTHLRCHAARRGGFSYTSLSSDEDPLQALLVHKVLQGGVELKVSHFLPVCSPLLLLIWRCFLRTCTW